MTMYSFCDGNATPCVSLSSLCAASSELKEDAVKSKDTLCNATVRHLIDSSPTKSSVQKCLCDSSNKTSIEFKKPPELHIEKVSY